MQFDLKKTSLTIFLCVQLIQNPHLVLASIVYDGTKIRDPTIKSNVLKNNFKFIKICSYSRDFRDFVVKFRK